MLKFSIHTLVLTCVIMGMASTTFAIGVEDRTDDKSVKSDADLARDRKIEDAVLDPTKELPAEVVISGARARIAKADLGPIKNLRLSDTLIKHEDILGLTVDAKNGGNKDITDIFQFITSSPDHLNMMDKALVAAKKYTDKWNADTKMTPAVREAKKRGLRVWAREVAVLSSMFDGKQLNQFNVEDMAQMTDAYSHPAEQTLIGFYLSTGAVKLDSLAKNANDTMGPNEAILKGIENYLVKKGYSREEAKIEAPKYKVCAAGA